MKHTRGPWFIDYSCDLIRNGSSNSFIGVADLKSIPNSADIRLIAAAPEILETAQALFEVYIDGCHDLNGQHALWDLLRKALEKAGGAS